VKSTAISIIRGFWSGSFPASVAPTAKFSKISLYVSGLSPPTGDQPIAVLACKSRAVATNAEIRIGGGVSLTRRKLRFACFVVGPVTTSWLAFPESANQFESLPSSVSRRRAGRPNAGTFDTLGVATSKHQRHKTVAS